jgi:Holliday junction resolvase RusA-like endonuclease
MKTKPTAIQLDLIPWSPAAFGWPLVAVRIPIAPIAAPRPRGRVAHGPQGPFVHIYQEPWYEAWLKETSHLLREWWLQQERDHAPIALPCIVQQVSVFQRPPQKDHVTIEKQPVHFAWEDGPMWALSKEDLDNIDKGILDATVRAGILLDDRLRVMDGCSHKLWAAEDEEPHVDLRIWNAGRYSEVHLARPR